jgi:hypothetical protein
MQDMMQQIIHSQNHRSLKGNRKRSVKFWQPGVSLSARKSAYSLVDPHLILISRHSFSFAGFYIFLPRNPRYWEWAVGKLSNRALWISGNSPTQLEDFSGLLHSPKTDRGWVPAWQSRLTQWKDRKSRTGNVVQSLKIRQFICSASRRIALCQWYFDCYSKVNPNL